MWVPLMGFGDLLDKNTNRHTTAIPWDIICDRLGVDSNFPDDDVIKMIDKRFKSKKRWISIFVPMINGCQSNGSGILFEFEDENDAMLFKLMWK